MSVPPVHDAVRQVARAAYGRLVAWLATQWRDVAAAEDALATSFEKALRHWPDEGIPEAPEAWLLTVARRELLQVARHERLRQDPRVTALLDDEFAPEAAPEIPDARLRLLFVCAHPAIDPAIHAPLMLQTVLGLQADEIAAAMLVAPATLAQRLVRAKQKIRDSGIRFEEPEPEDLPERLQSVLEAIYGAYGLAWDALAGEHRIEGLRGEARFLAELVLALQPDSAEALGLVALIHFCDARREAQFREDRFVPLEEQDIVLWDRPALIEADRLLFRAARLSRPGPFQLEAALQSAHCQRAFTGAVPWEGICRLYEILVQRHPSTGARVAHAAALGKLGRAEEGLALLDAIPAAVSKLYQPWWVARAELLRSLDRGEEAAQAARSAIGLTIQPLLRKHLEHRYALGAGLGGDAATRNQT